MKFEISVRKYPNPHTRTPDMNLLHELHSSIRIAVVYHCTNSEHSLFVGLMPRKRKAYRTWATVVYFEVRMLGPRRMFLLDLSDLVNQNYLLEVGVADHTQKHSVTVVKYSSTAKQVRAV